MASNCALVAPHLKAMAMPCMISAASGPTLHTTAHHIIAQHSTAQHGRKNVSTAEVITVVAVLALCHLDMDKAHPFGGGDGDQHVRDVALWRCAGS